MAIRAKAKFKGDVTSVKLLMKHDMETGQRVDAASGEKIPAHHITELSCTWQGKEVFHCNLGPAVSKNPYISFKLKGPKVGDELSFASIDNKGEKDSGSALIK